MIFTSSTEAQTIFQGDLSLNHQSEIIDSLFESYIPLKTDSIANLLYITESYAITYYLIIHTDQEGNIVNFQTLQPGVIKDSLDKKSVYIENEIHKVIPHWKFKPRYDTLFVDQNQIKEIFKVTQTYFIRYTIFTNPHETLFPSFFYPVFIEE